MGLFDSLHCDYPLPDPEHQDKVFQTKDLEQTLSRYRITRDGRLWYLRRQVDPQAPNVFLPTATDESEDMNYHGDLCFYSSTSPGEEEAVYVARFTYGTVDWIRRAGEPEPVPDDSLERLARNAAALEQGRTTRIEALLARLEILDPEVAKQAVHAFNDKTDAARWLASPVLTLGGITPLQALADGKRADVLRVLNGILYGLPG